MKQNAQKCAGGGKTEEALHHPVAGRKHHSQCDMTQGGEKLVFETDARTATCAYA